MSRLEHPAGAPADCRLTLLADGDLLVELAGRPRGSIVRYVFNNQGHLVSLSHTQRFEGELFDRLQQEVMQAIRRCCLPD